MSELRTRSSEILTIRPDADATALFESVFSAYRKRVTAPSAEVQFDIALWCQLAELGLTQLTGAEARGGGGASWIEASALLGAAAAATAPVPIAEHDVLGGWLLEVSGLDERDGMRTVCSPDADGLASSVPWARDAACVVALWQCGTAWKVANIATANTRITPARNLAGEPSDQVQFRLTDLEAGVAVDAAVTDSYQLRLTLARCAQAAGAMRRVLTVVLEHVQQRVQFGKPLAKFQAVEALVADLAAEAALAQTATDAAIARAVACGWNEPDLLFSVAVAASTVGHACTTVVRNAHQAVGAIGATLEHELPRLTKSMLAHRGDVRSVHEWDAVVGLAARNAEQAGLWKLITSSNS